MARELVPVLIACVAIVGARLCPVFLVSVVLSQKFVDAH